MIDFESQVRGIPCIVMVMSHNFIEPELCADSSEDAGGGWEFSWHLCNMRGEPAPWLEAKMSDEDRERIEVEIVEELT